MELMLELAGVRPANEYLSYRGAHGVVVKPSGADPNPASCRICQDVTGCGDGEDLERFIREKPDMDRT